ncbi:hypothetical protein C5167_011270 [Papaver somniferum]|uniref:Uncharacterized protein n=1 Tax=Papaver somniferum TaxID=3469 RepID=A0A4Y7K3U5_PAPSO|nr:hypothetical protein C5167_011270 [Papaver somniferum]
MSSDSSPRQQIEGLIFQSTGLSHCKSMVGTKKEKAPVPPSKQAKSGGGKQRRRSGAKYSIRRRLTTWSFDQDKVYFVKFFLRLQVILSHRLLQKEGLDTSDGTDFCQLNEGLQAMIQALSDQICAKNEIFKKLKEDNEKFTQNMQRI